MKALAAGLCVVGFVLVSAVVVVRYRLLDADLYARALVRSDAYERTYTEVLADPELAELVEELLGDIGPGQVEPVQARAAATSALRLVVPPSLLRRGTQNFVRAGLSYVRGDVARLDGDVDVAELLPRVADAATTRVQAVLASLPQREAPSLDEYRTAVAELAERLAAGSLPDSVPVLADGVASPADVAAVLLAELGPEGPARQEQVVAAALAGDERDALIDGSSRLIRERAAGAVAQLRSDLEDGRALDVVAEVSEHAGQSKAAVVGRLDTARDAARWFSVPTAVVGVVLMVGGAGGLVWLERRRPARAALWLAGTGIAAGAVLLVIWLVVTRMVAAPLASAVETGPDSWRLPAGLRSLVGDVTAEIGAELGRTVRRLALVPLAGGVAVATGVLVASRLRLPTPRAVAAGAALGGIVAGLAWVVPGDAPGGRACNGAEELCDRAYDEVVYAATHNSMSSPDVVWLWPEQDGDIRSQLDAGVRALLIDTHHWTPLVSVEQLTTGEMALPPALAQQVYDSLGSRREPRPGAYLCHNQCAFGAIPLVEALTTVRDFLEANPDDVVTLIIQDAIPAEETADAFTAAGLDDYLVEHRAGTPWPTLGELIDRGERLVVFAEDSGPPPAWYQSAFASMQDTPFGFPSPDALSCEPNRGDPDTTLFLMNHWVTRLTPDRATAAQVNAHDVIVDRARRCAAERGLHPNFVAVDFYSIGDLVEAVRTLNQGSKS